MESTRQKKVGRLVQKELSEIFRIETRNRFKGNMITPTVVRMSPDLLLAKVYLSVFPSEKQDEVIEMVNSTSGEIRYNLGKKIGKQVKSIPELAFYIDDSLDYAIRIDNLLNS
jgi:ribosome-binding factor A